MSWLKRTLDRRRKDKRIYQALVHYQDTSGTWYISGLPYIVRLRICTMEEALDCCARKNVLINFMIMAQEMTECSTLSMSEAENEISIHLSRMKERIPRDWHALLNVYGIRVIQDKNAW